MGLLFEIFAILSKYSKVHSIENGLKNRDDHKRAACIAQSVDTWWCEDNNQQEIANLKQD
jgi:hypothetical protein